MRCGKIGNKIGTVVAEPVARWHCARGGKQLFEWNALECADYNNISKKERDRMMSATVSFWAVGKLTTLGLTAADRCWRCCRYRWLVG